MARHQVMLVLWGGASLAWVCAFLLYLPPVGYWYLLVLLGIFLADVGSYVFHYLIDHYGRPVAGGLVYEFQRHHLVPNGIVEKPLSEVMYPAALVATPILTLMLWPLMAGWLPLQLALLGFVLGSCWVLAQLFHRWAHMPGMWPVRLAQSLHLLVSPREHGLHHNQPFDTRFAVITGWSNCPLDSLRAPLLLDALMRTFGKQKRELVRSLEEISALNP